MIKTVKRGFSLIEVAIALVVIGILAAIAVPILSNVIGSSQEGAASASAEAIVREANAEGILGDGEVTVGEVEAAVTALDFTSTTTDGVVTVTLNDGCTAGIEVVDDRAEVTVAVSCP